MNRQIALADALFNLCFCLETARIQYHLQRQHRHAKMNGNPNDWLSDAMLAAEQIHALRAQGAPFISCHERYRPHPTDTDFISLVAAHAEELSRPMNAEQYAESKKERQRLHKKANQYHTDLWGLEQQQDSNE